MSSESSGLVQLMLMTVVLFVLPSMNGDETIESQNVRVWKRPRKI